jgi:hypothetical protein
MTMVKAVKMVNAGWFFKSVGACLGHGENKPRAN